MSKQKLIRNEKNAIYIDFANKYNYKILSFHIDSTFSALLFERNETSEQTLINAGLYFDSNNLHIECIDVVSHCCLMTIEF